MVPRLETGEFFAWQESQDMVLVSVCPSCLAQSRVCILGMLFQETGKHYGLPDVDMISGVGKVLGAFMTTFPASPKMVQNMKIQANFRLSFSPHLKLWVGFLPELAGVFPVHPSPGIISLHAASLGFSSCLIPGAGALELLAIRTSPGAIHDLIEPASPCPQLSLPCCS